MRISPGSQGARGMVTISDLQIARLERHTWTTLKGNDLDQYDNGDGSGGVLTCLTC